jgi:hypothetical protein
MFKPKIVTVLCILSLDTRKKFTDIRHYKAAPRSRALIPTALFKIFPSYFENQSFITVLPYFATGLYLSHISLPLDN